MRPAFVIGVATVVIGASSACSVLTRADENQCTNDGDCAKRGFAGAVCRGGVCARASGGADADAADATDDPKWGCLGRVRWPEEDPSRTVRRNGRIVTLLSSAPVVAHPVRVCTAIDVTCSSPLATTTTDDTGYFELRVPWGFRGTLEMTPPAGSELLPLVMPEVPPSFEDSKPLADIAVHTPTAKDLEGLLNVIGKTVDPEAGHLFGLAIDCMQQPTAGVKLEVSNVGPTSVGYYVGESGLPTSESTESTNRGEIGFVNLPPGLTTLRYTLAGRLIGKLSVNVRKGTVIAVGLAPTPEGT